VKASGSSTLRAGSFRNQGTLAVSGQATINGAFVNNGSVNLLDKNTSPNNLLVINGNYVGGANSSINVGFSTQAGTSDKVVINGAASGTTAVTITNLTPSSAFTTSPAIISATSGAETFTLAKAVNFGNLAPVLLTQASSSGQTLTLGEQTATVSVGIVPTSQALAGSVAVQATQNIGFQSNGAALDHLTDVRSTQQRVSQNDSGTAMAYAQPSTRRDPIAGSLNSFAQAAEGLTARPAVWARAFGDYEQRSGTANFTFAGQGFNQDLG